MDYYLDSGDFGEAFLTTDNRVIKITSNVNEACCCAMTLNKKNEHLINVYDVKIFPNGSFGILMDYVEQPSELENAFHELQNIGEIMGYTLLEIDEDDFDDFDELEGVELSEDASKLLEALSAGSFEARKCGFEPTDIKFENSGVTKDGKIVMFDHLAGMQTLTIEDLKLLIPAQEKKKQKKGNVT
ncbi:hypothetical protein LMH73_023990 [Vibrio splendidus]